MSNQRIQFTEWLPDQPANAGSLNDAKNVFPVGIGYGAFPSAEDYSNGASEILNSVFVAKFGNNIQVFAGSPTKLFKMDNTTLNLVDVSKAGGYGGNSTWKFEQFGKVVLATNNSEKIQSWEIGSSTVFADVDAVAPIAKDIAIVRDFVFAGNIYRWGRVAKRIQRISMTRFRICNTGNTTASCSVLANRIWSEAIWYLHGRARTAHRCAQIWQHLDWCQHI